MLWLLPLILIPCSAALQNWGRHGGPLTIPGRGALFVLIAVAAIAGAWLFIRQRRFLAPAPLAPAGASLVARIAAVHPAWWALGGLAWLVLGMLWTPVPIAGEPRVVERAGALAVAVAAWAAYAGRARPATVLALAGAGAGIVLTNLLSVMPASALGAASTGADRMIGRYPTPWWPYGFGQAAPFGLDNFNINGAMPLVAAASALALARGMAAGLRAGAAAVALAAMVAAWFLGMGTFTNDNAYAAFVGIAAIIGAGAVGGLASWLPGRWPLWTVGILAALGLAGQIFLIYDVDTRGVIASWAQRLFFWRCAIESLGDPAILFRGGGPGSAISVLTEAPAFPFSWLTVPSFPEHAHHEFWEVLVEGGLPLATLLGLALVGTVRGLWRQRHRPEALALLAAWAAAGAHAMIESHLAQPGPLLCLGLLAGLSWAVAAAPAQAPAAAPAPQAEGTPATIDDGTPGRLWGVVCLVAALFAILLAYSDLTDRRAGPIVVRWHQAQRDLERAYQMRHDPGALAVLDHLRAAAGHLDELERQRGEVLLRMGDIEAGTAAIVGHVERNPADAYGLRLLRHLRDLALPQYDGPLPARPMRYRADWAEGARLDAVYVRARARAAEALAICPTWPKNEPQRRALAAELALPPR